MSYHPVDAGRAEDIAWMAATGENAQGAAKRLGMTYSALEQWAKRHTPGAWAALVLRNPRDHNTSSYGRNGSTDALIELRRREGAA